MILTAATVTILVMDQQSKPPRKKDTRRMRAAKSRLRMELAGLAFAVKTGHSPQEYARFVWGQGAVKWMSKEKPTKKEYLQKEMEAMRVLFPWMKMKLVEISPHRVELHFIGGCVGGWGEDRWALARSLGLDRWDVCRYCGEAFKVWAKQLGLKAAPHPAKDGSCKLIAWEWPEDARMIPP